MKAVRRQYFMMPSKAWRIAAKIRGHLNPPGLTGIRRPARLERERRTACSLGCIVSGEFKKALSPKSFAYSPRNYSSTTTNVQGCFIAGLRDAGSVFLSGETSRSTPS